MRIFSNQFLNVDLYLQKISTYHNDMQAKNEIKWLKSPNFEWYEKLEKPKFTPPPIVFHIVWALVYLSMIVSLCKYLAATMYEITLGVCYFFLQIAGNFLWFDSFFLKNRLRRSLFFSNMILVFTLLSMHEFSQKCSEASNILYPYLIWQAIATCFMIYVVVKNSDTEIIKEKEVSKQD